MSWCATTNLPVWFPYMWPTLACLEGRCYNTKMCNNSPELECVAQQNSLGCQLPCFSSAVACVIIPYLLFCKRSARSKFRTIRRMELQNNSFELLKQFNLIFDWYSALSVSRSYLYAAMKAGLLIELRACWLELFTVHDQDAQGCTGTIYTRKALHQPKRHPRLRCTEDLNAAPNFLMFTGRNR